MELKLTSVLIDGFEGFARVFGLQLEKLLYCSRRPDKDSQQRHRFWCVCYDLEDSCPLQDIQITSMTLLQKYLTNQEQFSSQWYIKESFSIIIHWVKMSCCIVGKERESTSKASLTSTQRLVTRSFHPKEHKCQLAGGIDVIQWHQMSAVDRISIRLSCHCVRSEASTARLPKCIFPLATIVSSSQHSSSPFLSTSCCVDKYQLTCSVACVYAIWPRMGLRSSGLSVGISSWNAKLERSYLIVPGIRTYAQ